MRACGLDLGGMEEVGIILWWLVLGDALTFQRASMPGLYSQSISAREAGQGVVFLGADGAFRLRKEQDSLRVQSELQAGSVRTQLAWILFISVDDKYLVSCYHGPGLFPGADEMLIKSR